MKDPVPLKVSYLGVAWNPVAEDLNFLYVPDIPCAADYRIRVISTWDDELWDESDGLITVPEDDDDSSEEKAGIVSAEWTFCQ